MSNTVSALYQMCCLPHVCNACGQMMGDEDGTYYMSVRILYDGVGDFEVIHSGETQVKHNVYYHPDCTALPQYAQVVESQTYSGRVIKPGDKFRNGDCSSPNYY